MNIKEHDGNVNFIMRAGQGFVRNAMPVSAATDIINKGKTEESTMFPGYGIAVDDTYFFEGKNGAVEVTEPVKKSSKRRNDRV